MGPKLRISVTGAGAVGMRHLEILAAASDLEIVAIVDPAPPAAAFARTRKIPYYTNEHARMLDVEKPDAALIATPNSLHLENALACVERRIPFLLEKPITETIETALQLVAAADKAGVPFIVGHHRRYNPAISVARKFIGDGAIGEVTAVNGTWFRRKPDDYFEMEWRRKPGGGPILINAIHDIDTLRVLCGEIDVVQAMSSNMARGFEVEDTVAAMFRFSNGALGTFLLSDAVQAPWGWELCAGENASWYPQQPVDCYIIGGTKGSLTIPSLEHWWNKGGGGRGDPMQRERLQYIPGDPHIAQWRHFAAVVRGTEKPMVSGMDATRTLAVTLALAQSTKTGQAVPVASILPH